MPDQQRFQNADLVLRVSPTIDPRRFELDRYEPFIDALCGMREYQKDAIRTCLRYLLGGRYQSLRELADQSFHSSTALQERYGTFAEMERRLQLPDQLAASVDLATATGKSYVMYGIARIMLAEGAVDQVLVLCPSRTIERGLTQKFIQASAEASFKELLPEDARVAMPHIINGTESIVEGSICIENFHATLEHVGSSIRHSLAGKGARTLVLDDEVHHVYAPSNTDLRRWKEFLLDPTFGFRYILGFSGTCYSGNDYFADVISRFSLRQAIEEGYAKTIEYVAEDAPSTPRQKLQKIYDNHQQQRFFYRQVKALTILVTKDIATCKRLTGELIEFLAEQEGIPEEEAARKVLTVTSATEHAANVARLDRVDRSDEPVEWIISVSMLTEGWDVQNVFQIVPHEERAFNSKLLIAQVLGRGLRIPQVYKGERPNVIVFNHDAWTGSIKHLVDEVLEIEKRIGSYPVEKDQDYNFYLHRVDYGRTPELEEATPQIEEYEFSKEFISLASQVDHEDSQTTYARAVTGERRVKRTLLRHRMYSVDEVAEHIHNKFKALDLEGETNYADLYGIDWLKALIRESLRRVGETHDRVSEENRQKLQAGFGVVHRGAAQTVRYRVTPETLSQVRTDERRRDSISLASVRRGDASIFIDEHTLALSDEDTLAVVQSLIDDEDRPLSALTQVTNAFFFKTPLNLVIADHRPERWFLQQLIIADNAKAVDGWIKSPDQDFYSVEYAWRKGEHMKRGAFNPDFFIREGQHVWVMEIKGDEELGEPSDENKAKFKAASRHFGLLNELQEEAIYHFHFLTPKDYGTFFQFVRSENFDFVSELDVTLGQNGS